jgi:pentatricopeptide repeat domain-containing protein 1
MDDLRALFVADQQSINGLQVGNQNLGLNSSIAQDSVQTSAPSHLQSRAEYVGWGGQAIPDSQGLRVPWFGRTRVRGGHSRTRAVATSVRGEQALPGAFGRPAHSMQGGGGAAFSGYEGANQDALTVEQCLALIQKLPKAQRVPDRIYRALYHFDSRVLSLLLKDLSKAQLSYRAVEMFDYLRSLEHGNLLTSLCDVYTYTAMISMCIYQQDSDRAMELMEDMRYRNVERNVHTFTALMNVCIKCGKHTVALEIYDSMRAANIAANVVTYNSLVDVYGKLGQWEKAAHVLHMMKGEVRCESLLSVLLLVLNPNLCHRRTCSPCSGRTTRF